MSEIQSQPEQDPENVENESETRRVAFNEVLGTIHCSVKIKEAVDFYNGYAIDRAAAKYFDAAHIDARPTSVAVWKPGENEPAAVLSAVVSRAMFNVESILPDEERVALLDESIDALWKVEMIEGKPAREPFLAQTERYARRVLNGYVEDDAVSESEYKRLFGIYKQLYITKYRESDYPFPRTPRLSFWSTIAEGSLMRVLGRQRRAGPAVPQDIVDRVETAAFRAEATDIERRIDNMDAEKHDDDPEEPNNGAGV